MFFAELYSDPVTTQVPALPNLLVGESPICLFLVLIGKLRLFRLFGDAFDNFAPLISILSLLVWLFSTLVF